MLSWHRLCYNGNIWGVYMLDNGHMQDNYCRKSKVIRVIDGDTIECEIDLGYSITTRQRFRIKGIDTPELKGSDILKALEGILNSNSLKVSQK